MRLVDADKLKEDMIRGCRRIGKEMGVVMPTSAFVNIIDKAPTEEFTFEEAFQKTVCEQELYCPKRPQGKWVENPHIHIEKYNCSICGEEVWGEYEKSNYCPNCGADMRGEEE